MGAVARRGHSSVAPSFYVGPGLDKGCDGRRLAVLHGAVQGCLRVVHSIVCIGASGQEQFYDGNAILTHGNSEGREGGSPPRAKAVQVSPLMH